MAVSAGQGRCLKLLSHPRRSIHFPRCSCAWGRACLKARRVRPDQTAQVAPSLPPPVTNQTAIQQTTKTKHPPGALTAAVVTYASRLHSTSCPRHREGLVSEDSATWVCRGKTE